MTLTYETYLGLLLNKSRIAQNRAMEVARGIGLFMGAKPDFADLVDSDDEAKLAEFRWEADKMEMEAMQGRRGNHGA